MFRTVNGWTKFLITSIILITIPIYVYASPISTQLISSYLLIPIIFLSLTVILWFIFGKDKKVNIEKTPKFTKTDDILEVSLTNKGELSPKDILALIIVLAEKGFINIEEPQKNGPFSLKNVRIVKKREYTGNNEIEKMLFDAIFYEKRESLNEELLHNNYKQGKASKKFAHLEGISIKISEFEDGFLKEFKNILKSANSKENYNKFYEKKSTIIGKITDLFSFVITLSSIGVPTYIYGGLKYLIGVMAILSIIIALFKYAVLNKKVRNDLRVIVSLISILLVLILSRLPLYGILIEESTFIIGIVLSTISAIVVEILVKFMPKRTELGSDILGEIKGFKLFLDTATKDEIEAVIKEDPTYFFENLPYAYVLGYKEVFLKLFGKSVNDYPEWYITTAPFSLKRFYKNLQSILDYIKNHKIYSLNSTSTDKADNK